ncbi:MAG: tyrosine-type recombinase/integrase [Dehalococcoidia bacterium]|nr:tyrosine-type recombinase/integrase [Dehalococcoidia bacterium]
MATGSLQKRSKGSWTLKFDVGVDPQTGRRKQQAITVKGTKREAEVRLREVLNSLDNGVFVKPERLTVDKWLDQWLQTYVAPNLSAKTADGYRSIVRHHLTPHLGPIQLQHLTPARANEMYQEILGTGVSAKTCLNVHRVLVRSLNEAVKLQLIVRNPAQSVSTPRAKRKEMVIPTDEQTNGFMEAIESSPFREALILSIYTGLRRGELLGLRWCDLNLEFATLSVNQTLCRVAGRGFVIGPPKTARSRRTIALQPSVCIMLRGLKNRKTAQLTAFGVELKESDLVFSTLDGKPFEPSSLTHACKRIMRKIGCDNARLHDLRHLHASRLLRQGTNIKTIQQRLGHSSIAVTMDIYAHVTPDMEAEAALKFEEGLTFRDQNVINSLERAKVKVKFVSKRP